MLKTVIVYERPEALEVKLITKFLDEFIISLFLAEAIKIQIILCQRLLFCKQFAVCRTDKIPLGTKGRTSILSIGSIVRPAELHSPSAEENCMTVNVSSLRSVKVATPPCTAYAVIPCVLAVRKQHKMLFAASKFESD